MPKIVYFFWHLYLLSEFFLRGFLIRITIKDEVQRRHRYAANTTLIGRKFTRAFRMQIKVNGREKLEQLSETRYLAVCNHVSYTDIILLASLENFVFITSVEMGNNPFLGSITRYGGCLFTNRKKYISLPDEINKFATTVKQGFKVMLFPEGTSTNGDAVKEFRKSLFQTAILAQCPVLPLCINYKKLNGKEIDESNRDQLYWYGDMTFAPHFMKLLGSKIEVEINILDIIPYQTGKMRQELSEEVYSQISSCFAQNKTTIKG